MKNVSQKTDHNMPTKEQNGLMTHNSNMDKIAKGVATGITVSTIVQTGRGVAGKLARNPLFMFGAGIAVGYFAHKYRKQIISATQQATVQTKEFLLRQKENLKDALAESEGETD